MSHPTAPNVDLQPVIKPAEMLLGLQIKNGWRVIELAMGAQSKTGGCFSVGYIVQKDDGARAFMKAFDFFSWITNREDPLRDLEPLVRAYNYERDLLSACGTRGLTRIVRAIDDGTVNVPGVPGPLAAVPYLIFELAEGDVRLQLDASLAFDTAWALRALHQVAVALNQLHVAGMVHQDLKPSNVLMFEERSSCKVGDLGRAASKGSEAPLVWDTVAGDKQYSPPENLYHVASSEWQDRLMRDAYHLGSMIVFFFTQTSMTALLGAHLESRTRWTNWTGSYEEVLPFLSSAFEEAVNSVALQLPASLREDLKEMITDLCNPDSKQRGRRNRRRDDRTAFSLQQAISRLNVLATRAEYAVTRQR
jgi:serine/threonine protein kinase